MTQVARKNKYKTKPTQKNFLIHMKHLLTLDLILFILAVFMIGFVIFPASCVM
jgi:hypothetical protein